MSERVFCGACVASDEAARRWREKCMIVDASVVRAIGAGCLGISPEPSSTGQVIVDKEKLTFGVGRMHLLRGFLGWDRNGKL